MDEARAQEYQRRIAERQREEEKNRNLERIAAIKIREAEMAALAAGTAGTAKGVRGVNRDALEDDDDADHADAFDVDDESGVEKHPELRYPVYADAALYAFKARTQSMSPDKDLRKRDEDVARLLQAKGNERLIGLPESPRETMENLRLCMPHLGEVIDFIRDHLVLAAFSGKSCRLPPMLLGGEPGIGKTHFAHLLACMREAEERLNDFRAIKAERLPFERMAQIMGTADGKKGPVRWSRKLTAVHTLERHQESMAWLRDELPKGDPDRTVVVTHHFPHKNSCAPKWANERLTAIYGSNVPNEVLLGASLWVHGHTHDSCNYRIGDSKRAVRVVCNPRGYPVGWLKDEFENESFDPGLLVEV